MTKFNPGKIIGELRIQKGMTQQELSDLSNIDIRTVQRIECGEVNPRFSTLNLIANALEVDISLLREDKGKRTRASYAFYRFTWIVGVLQLLNLIPLVFWKDYQSSIPIGDMSFKTYTLFPLLHIIVGTLFYYGFYVWGKHCRIKPLMISSIILILIIPLSEILLILNLYDAISYSKTTSLVITIIIGLNRILFGAGIFQIRNHAKQLVFVTGVLMVFAGLLYIIPFDSIQITGTILYFPVLILLILLLYRESKVLLEASTTHDQEV